MRGALFSSTRLSKCIITPGTHPRRLPVIVTAAKKGFSGSRNTKKTGEGWEYAANVTEFEEKAIRAVTLKTGKMVVVYKTEDSYYSSDVNSTAFDFPLVDANIFDGADGPAIECPLDGTTYDLATGKVIDWCPTNNPLRSMLGMLKSKAEPEDLAVHEVFSNDDGEIFVRMKNA